MVPIPIARLQVLVVGPAFVLITTRVQVEAKLHALGLVSHGALLQEDVHRDVRHDVPKPGGSVRGERADFTRLVLSCIEAKFCK